MRLKGGGGDKYLVINMTKIPWGAKDRRLRFLYMPAMYLEVQTSVPKESVGRGAVGEVAATLDC